MRWTVCSVTLALVVGSASIAAAEPGRFGPPMMTAPDALILKAGGCHRDEETHYVPEVGRTLPHVHIGEDCEPYRLSDSDADDDDDVDVDVDDDDDDDVDIEVDEPEIEAPDICVEVAGVEVCS
jgi:hypothetical protein